jgi:phosphatidylserine decarboxylase
MGTRSSGATCSSRSSPEPTIKVKKGDELGYFSYGGSTLAIAFEKGMIDRFTVPRNKDTSASRQDDGPPIYVNAELAVAR